MPPQLRSRQTPLASPPTKTARVAHRNTLTPEPATQLRQPVQQDQDPKPAPNIGRNSTAVKSAVVDPHEPRPVVQDALPDRSQRPHLLRYTDLPSWMQDNPYITSHYRPPSYSFLASIRSLSYIHNETFNIYSHLLPALSVPFLAYYFYTQVLSPPFLFRASSSLASNQRDSNPTAGVDITSLIATNTVLSARPGSQQHLLQQQPARFSTSLTSGDAIVWFCFFVGIFTCLGTSATYHCVSNVSPVVQKWGNQLDYVGIVALIWGSFVPTLWYGFWCEEKLLRIYLGMISVFSLITAFVSLHPLFRTPVYRPVRAGMFVALGLSAIFPLSHLTLFLPHLHKPQHPSTLISLRKTLSLEHVVLQGLLYIVGATIYALRVPERLVAERVAAGAVGAVGAKADRSKTPKNGARAPEERRHIWFGLRLREGMFDVWGASHQIFHALIVIAVVVHGIGVWNAMVWRHGDGGQEC